MAQKKSRNPKAKPAATPQANKAAKSAPSRKKLSLAHWLLLALGFGLYLNTVNYEFALDDKLYITYNQFTKKGTAGIPDLWKNELLTGFYGTKRNLLSGGRYRPMSLTTHAIEWSLLGPDEEAEKAKRARGQWTADDDARKKAKLDSLAHAGHFLNAVIYGLTGLVLYIVLCHLFPPDPKKKWYLTFPFIATALYIAHPLHTEVVANIKSRDELMSVLGALGALYYTLQHLRNHKYQPLFLAGGCMLFSLFSKESAVTFLGIIPLTAFFFTKAKPGRVVLSTLILIAISMIWLVTRFEVIGWDQPQPIAELMNDPFLGQSEGDKFATIFYTMGLYIKLLVFPHPLTHDYYPYHIPI
ncbi:MAG: tetratricopeptide repeat protein, partial [Bacteroidota bacterium]